MPVQIPNIRRFDAQPPQQSERLQVESPNLLGATAPIRQGVGNLIEAGADVEEARLKALRKQELAAKDLKATEAAIKYEQTLKSSLDGLKQLKGDVTNAYKEFDERSAKLEDETYTNVGEDAETRAILKEKIIKANGRIQDIRSTNQTSQYYNWQKEVADNSVKLRQDNAMTASQFLDVRNPVTFGRVQSALDEIEGTRIAIGIQNGYDIKQVKDEKTGKVTWDYSNAPAIEAQIKSDMGDAIIPMVKSLNAAGKVKEAKQLTESQAKWLNAKDLATLQSLSDEADVRNQALAYVATLQNKSGKAAYDEIEKSDKSDAIKFKAREIIDTYDRQNENALARKRKEAQSKLYQHVDDMQNSKNPYATPAQFKDTPLYKEYRDVLTPQDLKALEQRIEAPPTSDPKAKTKISDTWMSTGFAGMDTPTFNNLLVGLNKEDRDRYTRLRESITKPAKGLTESQARARANALNTFLFTDSKAAGIIPKKSRDKWDEADEKYYSETVEPAWQNYYNKHIDEISSDPNGQKAFVRDFVREFTQNPENTPPRKGWFGWGGRDLRQLPELSVRAQVPNSPLRNAPALGPKTAPTEKATQPAIPAVDISRMRPEQYDYWVNEYMKETGAKSEPEDPKEFQAWINKKVRK